MKSIRFKLIIPFLAGSVALTLLLSWYTYSSARRAVNNSILVISEAKTNQVETSMALLFKSLLSSVQNFVVDPHVTSLFPKNGGTPPEKTTGEWVDILTQGNDYYRDILITDKDGVCIVSGNPGFMGKSFADKTYVQKALNGMFTIEDISVGLLTKKLSSIAAGPVDIRGNIVGALVVISDFPQIVAYGNDSAERSEHLFTSLLNADGLFVAHKDKALMSNRNALFPDLYKQLHEVGRQGGLVRYMLGGKSWTGYAKVEPVSKWIVLTSGPDSDVFASASRVGFVVFGISLAVLCIISAVVVRFANGILDSLIALIDYAKHISEGRFEAELETTTRQDELGVLHSSLRRLVETLQTMLFQTQEASRMKGEFLANMSHEIRTPINAIMGMSHLALRDSSMSAKVRGYLDKIQMATRSLLGVINDILDISKIEAGKFVLEDVSFDLRQLVEDTLAIHQVNAHLRSLDLTLEYDPEIPQFLTGDSLRIGQVLNNLLGNAIKFTQEGSIVLFCRLSEAGADTVLVRIGVADTGIGIKPEALARLFQPFTQADSSITRQFGGTGLGLAISRSVLRLMDSDLEVSSEPGKGSTFSFEVRLSIDLSSPETRRQDGPTEEDFERLNLAGRVILIAEDNEINQMILEELIAPSKAVILLANNGQEAVDAVREKHVDLVFMDMQMPVMDGIQATKLIRAFTTVDNLPIIAVTANAMKEDREKVFACGMNEFITKPVEVKQLYNTLRLWMAGKLPVTDPGSEEETSET